MSAVFKRLERRDAFISPYTAHKTFTFASSSFGEVGIEWKRGVSGSFPYNEEALTYAGIKQIMFDSYGQTSTEFNWTSSLGNQVNVLSIPRNLYGTSLKPGSVTVTIDGEELSDDNGYIVSGSEKVGYISYSKGLLAFTGGGYEELGAFESASTSQLNFTHTENAYAAYTQSIHINPATDPNPFQPGLPTPNTTIEYLSSSFDFSGLYIYGAADIESIGSAWYLAPKLTLTVGGVTSSFFARLVDDQTVGTLGLTFPSDIYHPSIGLVDVSDSSDYSQLSAIDIEYKLDPPSTLNVPHAFLPTGSWTSSLFDYPSSSSLFEVVDGYKAYIGSAEVISLKRYIQSLDDVPTVRVDFASSSIQYNYSGGDYTASLQATEPILTHTYHCQVDPNEFGLSYNPSIQDTTKVSGSLLPFATGSDFRPYATTIGLYNSANELIAVGKLSEATPILNDTHYTFVVQIDL